MNFRLKTPLLIIVTVVLFFVISALINNFVVKPTLATRQVRSSQKTLVAMQVTWTEKNFKQLVANAPYSLGDPAAPVKMVVFCDYTSAYCNVYQQTTAQIIKEKYIDTGKVQLLYWPVFGNEYVSLNTSMMIAEAAACTNEQGTDYYWKYVDVISDPPFNAVDDDIVHIRSHLIEIGGELKLNTDLFGACITSGKYREYITGLYQNASVNIGVQSVPTLLVNGTPIVGIHRNEYFIEVIESYLNNR